MIDILPTSQPATKGAHGRDTTPLLFDKLLDVNSVLELGYSIHVTNDPKREKTKSSRNAHKLLDEFHSWSAPFGTKNHVYLFKMRELVGSLGNAITRHKELYLKEVEAADHKRVEQLTFLRTRRDDFIIAFLFKTSVSLGIMAIAGAIGFALAETIIPFVPLRTEHTQSAMAEAGYWPSVLVAALFAAISKNLSKWISQRRLEKVFWQYEMEFQQAGKRYSASKLAEYERTEQIIRQAFKEYTGRNAGACVTYAAILNEEIVTDKSLSRERERLSENILIKTLARFRRMRKTRMAKQKTFDSMNAT